MRHLLRAMVLTTLLFTGAALEVSQARAGDGFARYLQQQARFLARMRKPNSTRTAVKATTKNL